MSTAPAPPEPGATVAVAFSGGRDSLALLHATLHAAHALGIRVAALHVHHGLMPEADAWERQARALCRRWRGKGWPLTLWVRRLSGGPGPGQSVEAWARRERYAALADMARAAGAPLVLLAHHRRDQAETVLLQALRGAGPRGLAAMPRCTVRDGLTWARPWLDQPRDAIDAYVRRHRLRPVDDASNRDRRYARSRLRSHVWPALAQAFPDAEQALAGVAARAQEADAALREWVATDLARCLDGTALMRSPWLELSAARRALVLRAWLDGQGPAGASHALVQRLLTEWPRSSSARWPAAGGGMVRAWRQQLVWVPAAIPALADGTHVVAPAESGGPARPPGVPLDLRRPGLYPVPAFGGTLEVRSVRHGGLALEQLAAVQLSARAGGEQYQRGTRTVPRSLKKAYQEAGVPPDARGGPLCWAAGRLLFVPGLGLDARAVAARPGPPRRDLRWIPARA